MRQVPGRALWIGHVGDTRQPRLLLDAGIKAVVELADSEPFATLPRELIRCRFPLSDGGGNPLWLMRLAVESVAALIRADVPTLVCCGCGMSRSVSIAAGGLAQAEGLSLDEALKVVAGSGPVDVSPGLWAEMRRILRCERIGEPRHNMVDTMDEQTQKTGSLPELALACRLRRKLMLRRGPASPLVGEVELENLSHDVVEIEWDRHPLQYLDLVIMDGAGSPVPATPYSDIFSPYSVTPQIFRLAPGEKYIHNVGLLHGVPDEKQLPGTYTVRAVYEYQGLKAVSEPVEVQIPEPASVSTGEVAGRLR
jgi:hypothetical protein